MRAYQQDAELTQLYAELDAQKEATMQKIEALTKLSGSGEAGATGAASVQEKKRRSSIEKLSRITQLEALLASEQAKAEALAKVISRLRLATLS